LIFEIPLKIEECAMENHHFPIIACRGRFLKASMMDLAYKTYPKFAVLYAGSKIANTLLN
jgi:hypothetical protein